MSPAPSTTFLPAPGFVGDPRDGIGYIDLSGFANDAGREVRFAIRALQHGAQAIAMRDSGATEETGMVMSDPTMLKVSSRRSIFRESCESLIPVCLSHVFFCLLGSRP